MIRVLAELVPSKASERITIPGFSSSFWWLSGMLDILWLLLPKIYVPSYPLCCEPKTALKTYLQNTVSVFISTWHSSCVCAYLFLIFFLLMRIPGQLAWGWSTLFQNDLILIYYHFNDPVSNKAHSEVTGFRASTGEFLRDTVQSMISGKRTHGPHKMPNEQGLGSGCVFL